MKNRYLPRLPGSEVFSLDGLVECRAHQVLSLAVYRAGGDSVSAYAFDAGEGISQEVLDEDCLYWVLEGEVAMTAGGPPRAVRGGECFVVPAGTPHAVDIVAPTKLLTITVG